MNNKITKEVKTLIKKLNLNCSVKEFKDKVNWNYISTSQTLSEDFIREFKNKVDWPHISTSQTLSEDFIREFKDKIYWPYISSSQTLSEDFIREFKDKIDWYCISSSQTLSKFGEDFIKEFKNKVDWKYISFSQNLSNFSNKFMEEFKSKIDIELQKEIHAKKTLKQKIKEVKIYAKKHNLKYDKDYLYAFRNHDKNGSGIHNKAIKYKKGKYYKDWHCDMREDEENSFGLGIWPEGNTKIRVKINDWGVAVNKNDGKARVMGFEVI